ncbi:hypothetical protein E2C01_071360 [Portunus trituberculatus]|uniref:Peptidase A2 domain-containing protein n=1 Tax=Portunus trituberculatus TaxID=210409 RepID=A0A5B7I811_PORTR|nr:hypothetical protein [Portunus trituberculatus]
MLFEGLMRGEEVVISMVAEPEAFRVSEQLQPMTCPRLEVAEGNMVLGSVGRHQCKIMLDSASNCATISYSFAKQARLITGLEMRMPVEFEAWYGKVILSVILLPSVTIKLEDKVKLRTSLLVIPREVEEAWDYPNIVLDVHIFQLGKMLHVFRSGRSFLYIRDPDNLRRRIHRLPNRFNTFKVRRANDPRDKTFIVLLDTGTANFHLSDFCRQQFIPQSLINEPLYVHIYLVGRCPLETDQVKLLPSMKYDFVMGRNLLFKYNATVDYGNHFVTFQVGSYTAKVNLLTS